MDPVYKRIAAYAGEDNVKKFRDMVERAQRMKTRGEAIRALPGAR